MTTSFEGHALRVLRWKGRPAWVASDVSRALGYADGSKLSERISSEWREEFIPEVDFEMVEGEAMAELVRIAPPDSGVANSMTRHLTLLFESGLHMALLKTRKPAGIRLRRLLVTEVLPKLVRTGGYQQVAPAPPQLPAPPAAKPPGHVSAVFPPDVYQDLEQAAKRLDCSVYELVERVVDLWRADCRPLPPYRRTAPPSSAQEAARITQQVYVLLNTTALELDRLQKLTETTRATLGASEGELHAALVMLDALRDEDAARAMLGLVKQARGSKQSCAELMSRLLGAASRLPTKS